MKVPFLDLRAAYLELASEIDTAVARVLSTGISLAARSRNRSAFIPLRASKGPRSTAYDRRPCCAPSSRTLTPGTSGVNSMPQPISILCVIAGSNCRTFRIGPIPVWHLFCHPLFLPRSVPSGVDRTWRWNLDQLPDPSTPTGSLHQSRLCKRRVPDHQSHGTTDFEFAYGPASRGSGKKPRD